MRQGEDAHGYSFRPFDERGCIFVHVPKAAGVSVCTSLFGSLAAGHSHVGLYQLVFSKREFDAYFKFAFVRNPWDRMLSAYSFLRTGGMDDADRAWSRAGLSGFPTFDEFVRGWVTEENVLSHIHFVPQYRFVCEPFTRRIAVDFVGRYEDLERGFAYVREHLGLDGDAALPHANRGPSEHRDFREHYTALTRGIVERVYRTDVELFGYQFDS